MKLLSHMPNLHQFETVDEFISTFVFSQNDLILTNRYILNEDQIDLCGAQVIYQEDHGKGEPSDEMVQSIYAKIKRPYTRVIGAGGGTILDIAKLLALKNMIPLLPLYRGEHEAIKLRRLVLVPTTCGTGSEVTNISVLGFNELGTKLGLVSDALYADDAVLLPVLLSGLPYSVFAHSSLDALIHGVESFLSPKATVCTRMYSKCAISMILRGYCMIAKEGSGVRLTQLSEFLTAATFAGLAFGTAGCGTVHAMSYPISAKYHVPHGEANYALMMSVLKIYNEKDQLGALHELKEYMADVLECDVKTVLVKLENLLSSICPAKRLSAYGMTETEIQPFTTLVMKTQGRLLSGSMLPMSLSDLKTIYRLSY